MRKLFDRLLLNLKIWTRVVLINHEQGIKVKMVSNKVEKNDVIFYLNDAFNQVNKLRASENYLLSLTPYPILNLFRTTMLDYPV